MFGTLKGWTKAIRAAKSPGTELALVSVAPPPHGGVATHIKRLLPYLRDRAQSFRVYNTISEAEPASEVLSVYPTTALWLALYAWMGREKRILFQTSRVRSWLVGGLMARLRKKEVILWLRNATLPDVLNTRGLRAYCARWAIRSVDGVIGVSELLCESARAAGARRVLHCPGFLPPTDEEVAEREAVSTEVWEFCQNHHPLMAANGKIAWYQGQDLYGLDLLIEAVALLKPHFDTIGLIICFWAHRQEDEQRMAALQERVAELGLQKHILFKTEPGPLVPILAASDIFVRPTNTDGDAASIREAQHLGVPVVASDAVSRPEPVTLFKNRDVQSLVDAIQIALEQSPAALHLDDFERAFQAYLDWLCAGVDAECDRKPQNFGKTKTAA